jgi:ribonuclease R
MATRDNILAHVRGANYRPQKTRALARFFDIREENYPQFRRLLHEMIADGEIILGSGRRLMAAPAEKKRPEGTFSGIFRLHPKGFGFLEPDDAEMTDDVFVAPGDTLDAISGDHVLAKKIDRRYKKAGQLAYTGRIVEVLARGQTRFVGTYRVRGKVGTIKPDGGMLHDDIPVGDATSSGAKPNDKVVFELLKYPARNQRAEAVIVEVLGARGEPGVDTLAVIRQYDLPDEFPDEVLEAARQAADRFTDEEIARRTDLRDVLTITIDPETARDYDDAISIERLADGIVRLGVHIADVSFFVRPGETLDTEAYERGTSTYLPTLVVPMLPELLSNGMCSLQEAKDRLAKSAFIHLDRDARIVKTEFANTVIRNRKRLTYEQVNQVLDEGQHDIVEPDVLALLQEMNALARRILHRRRRAGYLELNLPSVDLIFDDQLRVIDAQPEDTSFSHKVIEMFMVEANEAVARHLRERRTPAIRRIHEAPSEEKLDATAKFLRSCGLELKNPGNRNELQQLLKQASNAPEAYPVHMAVLRSMMQAKYAVSDEGHWALASDCYCHFTSPIRRYPDLTVHRALAATEGWDDNDDAGGAAKGSRKKSGGKNAATAALEEVATHCSQTERRAEAAERELTKVKVLTLLEKHVGEEFTGIVAAVQVYGLFVEIPKYMIEGLVHIRDLHDDNYEFDSHNYCLFGRKLGRKVRVGDTIRVVIASVDIPRRELDLSPAPGTAFSEVPTEAKTKVKTKTKARTKATKGRKKPAPAKRGKKAKGQRKQKRKR